MIARRSSSLFFVYSTQTLTEYVKENHIELPTCFGRSIWRSSTTGAKTVTITYPHIRHAAIERQLQAQNPLMR